MEHAHAEEEGGERARARGHGVVNAGDEVAGEEVVGTSASEPPLMTAISADGLQDTSPLALPSCRSIAQHPGRGKGQAHRVSWGGYLIRCRLGN